MVNNVININKMNNHLSSQIIEHKKDHENEDLGPGLGQAQNVAG